jgi:hypothetical protein
MANCKPGQWLPPSVGYQKTDRTVLLACRYRRAKLSQLLLALRPHRFERNWNKVKLHSLNLYSLQWSGTQRRLAEREWVERLMPHFET